MRICGVAESVDRRLPNACPRSTWVIATKSLIPVRGLRVLAMATSLKARAMLNAFVWLRTNTPKDQTFSNPLARSIPAT